MSKQDTWIAACLILQGLVGAGLSLTLAMTTSPSIAGVLVTAPLVLAALVAGLGSLRNAPWARKLGMIVFAVQVPIVHTQSLSFSFFLGAHFDLALALGPWKLGVNLVGLALLVWAMVRSRAIHQLANLHGQSPPPVRREA